MSPFFHVKIAGHKPHMSAPTVDTQQEEVIHAQAPTEIKQQA